MGCGASAKPKVEEQKEPEPVLKPLVPVDPAKFTSIFKKEGGETGVSAGTWLTDTTYIYVCGDNLQEEHPVEVLDVTTKEATKVNTLAERKMTYPSIEVSPDRTRYAMCSGATVHIVDAKTHQDVCSFAVTVPSETDYVSSLRFSPDGKHIALSHTGKPATAIVHTAADGAEVVKFEFDNGNQGFFFHWYDVDTLLAVGHSDWRLLAYSISGKKELCKYEIPKGSFTQDAFTILPSKLLFVGDGNGTVHLMEYDGKALFTIKESVKVDQYSGPVNLTVFSDERGLLYEKGGGGHFTYYIRDKYEKKELKRGDGADDDLPSISSCLLNSGETHLACVGFAGLNVFSLR